MEDTIGVYKQITFNTRIQAGESVQVKRNKRIELKIFA